MDRNQEIGQLILRVQDDISRLKEQLNLPEDEQNTVNVDQIRDALNNTQHGLQKRANELLSYMNNQVSYMNLSEFNRTRSSGNVVTAAPGRTGIAVAQEVQNKLQHFKKSGAVEVAAAAASMHPVRNSSVSDLERGKFQRRIINNPQNPQNRAVNSEKHGIQLPLINQRENKRALNDHLIGRAAAHHHQVALERIIQQNRATRAKESSMNNAGMSAAPPTISENEISKGLLSLIQRGFIPPAANITIKPSPVKNLPPPIMKHRDKLGELRIPADNSDPGQMDTTIKMDSSNTGQDDDYLYKIGGPVEPSDNNQQVYEQMAANEEEAGAGGGGDGSKEQQPPEKPPKMPKVYSKMISKQQKHMKEQRKENAADELNRQNSKALSRKTSGRTTNMKTFDLELAADIDESNRATKQGKLPPPTTPASQISKVAAEMTRFCIQNGRTREMASDFLNFKQQYSLNWGSIQTIIKLLEAFLEQYSVPIAFVNGDRVADLSVEYEMELVPSEAELISCILNKDDILRLTSKPGRRFVGPNGVERAAIYIQSHWRKYLARRGYLDYRRKKWAAGVLAIQWILHMKISNVRRNLKSSRMRNLDNFHKRNKMFAEQWHRIVDSRHVVIHLPSLGFHNDIRKSLDNTYYQLLQNKQMARLCDLTNPNVDVILVSSIPINEEMAQYYAKLLALKNAVDTGNVDDQKPIVNRYKIVVPEALRSFPTHHMCLSSLLKYSPKALSQIRTAIRGRKAFIVPGLMHQDDVDISQIFNCPVLGTDPDKSYLYSTKSGGRLVFKAADVPVPPGESSVYTLDQLHESLASLIVNNLQVKKWLFKFDTEFDSRGIACLDVARHLPCYEWAVKEKQRYGENWHQKWAQEKTLTRILSDLIEILPEKAELVNQKAYKSWNIYLKNYLSKGGVIEAYPPSESVTNVTVDLLIKPDKSIEIMGSGDQIHNGNPLNCWGFSMPMSSIEADSLNKFCCQVGHACLERGILGYFSVDFVTFIHLDTSRSEHQAVQVVWATDLTIGYSDSMALSNLARFVSNAVFDEAEHSLVAQPKKLTDEEKERESRKANLAINKESLIPVTQIEGGVAEDGVEDGAGTLNRYVTMSSQLLHTNLSMIHYSVFFQMCRAHGIGYDIREKQGTIFNLIDGANRERMSMITLSPSLKTSLSTFAKNLYILHQEISSPNMPGTTNFLSVIKEIEGIIGVVIQNSSETQLE